MGHLALILAAAVTPSDASAPVAPAIGAATDLTIPPGTNFDKAEFRLWYPASATAVQAVVTGQPFEP